MIRYSLKCAEGHSFDSWFKSADAYEALETRGLVSCAVCGGNKVTKSIMAPSVSNPSGPPPEPVSADAPAPLTGGGEANPVESAIKAIRAHVEENSTYVGGKFAEEARAIHLGDAPDRMIHGEAKLEEAKSLIEDGIQVAPLPFIPKDRSN